MPRVDVCARRSDLIDVAALFVRGAGMWMLAVCDLAVRRAVHVLDEQVVK